MCISYNPAVILHTVSVSFLDTGKPNWITFKTHKPCHLVLPCHFYSTIDVYNQVERKGWWAYGNSSSHSALLRLKNCTFCQEDTVILAYQHWDTAMLQNWWVITSQPHVVPPLSLWADAIGISMLKTWNWSSLNKLPGVHLGFGDATLPPRQTGAKS